MGRTLGAKNKLSKTIKDSIEHSFNRLPGGSSRYLLELAQNDPKTYCQLLAKVIPQQLNLDSTLSIDLGHALLDANDRLKTMRDVTPKRLEIAADSVAAGSVAAGSVAAGSVAAGSVAADSVVAGSVVADSVVADSVVADILAADKS
jgi:hypothetical protein